MGGKVTADDKKSLLDACKDVRNWLEQNGETATKQEFEEQKETLSLMTYPITRKLYESRAARNAERGGRDEL
jgi:endoplasmic reticulum chaperone BiP